MKLAVIAPMYWATEALAREKCWLYLKSCEKAGIPESMLKPYGIGSTQYPGNRIMRLTGQLEWLKTLMASGEGYTHVLYSDAWDVMFVRPLEVLLEKYKRLGSPPMLMAAAPREAGHGMDLHPPESDQYKHLFDATIEYGMPSGVLEIGEIGYIADCLSRIDPMGEHNYSRPMLKAYADGVLDPAQMDTGCELFQEFGFNMRFKEGRMYNPRTGSYPVVAHFSNGNPEQECGQDKLMLPWARALGICLTGESVAHKLDYAELERMYQKASNGTHCSHAGAKCSVHEHGVYSVRCPDCGLTGWLNEESARRLGWIA